jgi:RimJ/RimL family protein N-acetyltransferase
MLSLKLRPASDIDIKFYFDIRNIPEVYEGFYSQVRPLEWAEHWKWWFSRNQDWRKFVIEVDGKDIGIFNFGQLDHWNPEIGYAIHPDYWGRGYGTEAVRQAVEIIKGMGYKYCHTTVLKSNTRSIKLLQKNGFTYLGEARKGEIWLTKTI